MSVFDQLEITFFFGYFNMIIINQCSRMSGKKTNGISWQIEFIAKFITFTQIRFRSTLPKLVVACVKVRLVIAELISHFDTLYTKTRYQSD